MDSLYKLFCGGSGGRFWPTNEQKRSGRSMNTACMISGSRYARDSPVGTPWRASFFSTEGYRDVLGDEGLSGSRRPSRRLRLVSTSLVTASDSGSLGRRRIATSCLAASSSSLFLTREIRGLALRDRRDRRDRGGPSVGMYEP